MIKFVNRFTGSTMFVAEDRKDEYIEAGHKLASSPVKAVKAAEAEPEKEEPKEEPKKPAKKATRKK